MGSTGTPSASAGSGFLVTSAKTLSNRMGILFYRLQGPRLAPFQGGYRCVDPPVKRTPLQSAGGNAALDCSGVFSIDFNAWIPSDPALIAGQEVWGQYWSRDGGSSYGTNMGGAIAFTIGP
jgi:hypothetical protein